MTGKFDLLENLFRAVYPPQVMAMFWKENGEISSAAFKDKNGLSVERAGDRDNKKAIYDMRMFFSGTIISVLVSDCIECDAVVEYLPSKRSKYHSEIHGSGSKCLLSQSQCKYLARKAVIRDR